VIATRKELAVLAAVNSFPRIALPRSSFKESIPRRSALSGVDHGNGSVAAITTP